MRTFKKVIFSSLTFVLLLVVVSTTIILPWKKSESGYYMDAGLRENLAGEIDYIVIGASHGLAAFNSNIIDEKLGCFSYNLSGSMMPIYNRTYMLKKELARNPVKTVILEVSYNALTRSQDSEYGDGDSVTLCRLDSLSEKLHYLIEYVSLDDWLNVYCRDMVSSFSYWKAVFLGENVGHVDYSAKGYRGRNTTDVTIPDGQIIVSLNESYSVGEFKQDNITQFHELIDICKSYGCETIVVSTPISDNLIWKSKDMDSFKEKIDEICNEEGVPFIDFNLLKERSQIISDSTSFSDVVHMSSDGASAFTNTFCDCMNKINAGEDISELFYSSYGEMKDYSPYMEHYKAHCTD